MIDEHRTTREEKVYWRLLEEVWEELTEPARTVIGEARSAAYAENMVHNYCFQPEEYEEAMEKMRSAGAEITDHEHKVLAKVWRSALAAAASIDSEDFETFAGYRVYSGDLHWYYRMCSGMVEQVLQERKETERQKQVAEQVAEREPEDVSDLPF